MSGSSFKQPSITSEDYKIRGKITVIFLPTAGAVPEHWDFLRLT
jgi:hypothetical protein